LTLGAAAGVAVIVSHAVANVGDPDSDEIVRTAPETLPDLTVSATAQPTARAETQATPAVAAPLPIEAAETSARVMQEWAAPHLAQVQQTAARYEPNLEVKVAKASDGVTRTRVSLALGPSQPEIVDTLARKVGFHPDSRATFGNRGRWFLFTATSNDAVGYNMLQGMHGELHREGFTTERVAAIGDRQSGLAWRKGMLQASIGYVEREISTFGASVEQRFVALTISWKGWGRPRTSAPARDSRWAPYQPSWPPEERDPRLRR
jgi:hypothetical protein